MRLCQDLRLIAEMLFFGNSDGSPSVFAEVLCCAAMLMEDLCVRTLLAKAHALNPTMIVPVVLQV